MRTWRLSALSALLLISVAVLPVSAADNTAPNHQWLPPVNLFETEGRASEAEVVADPSGMVHVFWAYGAPDAEEEGWAQAIYYTRQENGAWSDPVDVLISPGGRVARMHSVAADSQGYLHIAWSGGNAIFYSRAYAPQAGLATAWAAPVALISNVSVLAPALAIGPDGSLYVVWTQANAGLVLVRSDDGGQSWSLPQVIFQADRNNELASSGRIAVDDRGRLHVVLTYAINDPQARYGRTDAHLLYYLRSEDRGATWSEPFLVTPEPDFGEINVATFGEDTVHLVWNGRAGRHGRYHRWSEDGGETWSNILEVIAPAPASPIGTGGLTGFPAVVTDGTGALHLVSATGRGQYYLRWAEGGWTAPLLISPGVQGGGVTNTAESIEQPSIAISQGNRLHVVFHDGFERIWYTGAAIDAPYVAPIALPTPASVPAALPAATPTVVLSPTAQPTPAVPPMTQTGTPDNPSAVAPLLLGVAPAVLLVGAVVVWVSARRRR